MGGIFHRVSSITSMLRCAVAAWLAYASLLPCRAGKVGQARRHVRGHALTDGHVHVTE